MNMNPLILANVQNSPYFKVSTFRSYHWSMYRNYLHTGNFPIFMSVTSYEMEVFCFLFYRVLLKVLISFIPVILLVEADIVRIQTAAKVPCRIICFLSETS
jgi:hypothetical protein